MSNKNDDLTASVIIAGGGPVGFTLSIALSNYGISNIVVERDLAPHPLPRAILIDGEIHRGLIQLGLGPKLNPLLTPMRTAEYVDANMNRLAGLDLWDKPIFGGLANSSMHYQPEIDALLESEAIARGAVVVRGAPFVGIENHSDGATLILEDGRRARGRFVVGCDGASSAVRRSAQIGWEDLGFNQDWLVVDIEVNDRATCGLPNAAMQICDPKRPVTLLSGHKDYFRWEFQLQPDEDPKAMNEPANVWKLLSRWITPDSARLIRSAAYQFHAVVATTMRLDSILLAGDAGHQMPPFMGQGLNSGMRDAFNLAWKLKWVLEGWSGDGLLDTYSSERREHAKATVEESVEAGRLIDQFAGRESHGIKPRDGYGGQTTRSNYTTGVLAGQSERVGMPFWYWDRVADASHPDAAMLVVSSTSRSVALPGAGEWRHVHADQKTTYGLDHVIVRPDGWVAAACKDAELDQALTDLTARLAG